MSEALILAKLATIEAKLDQLLAGGGASRGAAPATSNGQRSGGNVAGDDDLDSDRGNPTIYKDPPAKYWSGATSYAGFHLSEVPEPDYLDALAKYFDACAYMAAKDVAAGKDVEKNEKSAKYKAIDATRCRGWAKRIRARGVSAPTPNPADADYGGGSGDDDIPFAPPFDLGA